MGQLLKPFVPGGGLCVVALSFPKTHLAFSLQPLSNAYHELAQVYATNKPSELRNLVNKHSEMFNRDNNMGLVKQCLSSLYKKNIQRLTKVRRLLLGFWHHCSSEGVC